MKKIFSIRVFLLFTVVNLVGQVSSITASISNSNNDRLTFIQGATSFENVLTVSDVLPNTGSVFLVVLDDLDVELNSIEVFENNGSWEETVEMGEHDDAAVKIIAISYDANGTLIDESSPSEFNMIAEPASVSSQRMDIEAANINDGIATLEISIHLPDSSDVVDEEVVGLSGKKFGLDYNDLLLIRDFDMATSALSGDEISMSI